MKTNNRLDCNYYHRVICPQYSGTNVGQTTIHSFRDNVQECPCFGIIVNRRTLRGQRKVKVPVMKMSGKKKEKVQKDAQDSCDTPGCGCGN